MTRNKNWSPSDDRDGMDDNTSLTERDTEALIAGRVPSDPALAPVREVLASMKATLVVEPDPRHVSAAAAQFASVAAAAAREGGLAAPGARGASPWRRRFAAAVGVAAVSAFGVAGAAAADDAAPGDLLYGVDQALEKVGILDGGAQERLTEAQDLLDKGDVDKALQLTVDALESDGDGEAAAALHRAAVAVASQSSGDDVRAQVATMLQWMAGEESRGAEFGAAVSAFAQQISGKADDIAEDAGRKPETPGDAGKAPEAPGDAGKAPETPGDAGKAPETPGDAGKAPETPGDVGKAPETPAGNTGKSSGRP
jgi:hypothetical protein